MEYIQKSIKNNKVMLFMKGDPMMPRCGYSAIVINILQVLKVEFASYDVLQSDEIREQIKKYSDWSTIPQLYINGDFIGGSEIVRELFKNGKLQKLLGI